MKDIMPMMMTGYLCIVVFALHYTFNYSKSYKLVSECCNSDYRILTRSQKQEGQEPYCLDCKKWCELIEVKETK